MSVKLNQIIAVEKGEKSRHMSDITHLHRACAQRHLFDGLNKKYTPLDEDGEQFPEEGNRVQMHVSDILEGVGKSLADLFDVVATKDFGNTVAAADVKLEDGTVLLEKVPPTFLLFLEKQLNDIHTFVDKLPVLDPAESWIWDEDARLFRSVPTKTHKTKKVQEGLVLHAPTTEHPAQTQLITKDVTIGHWHTVKFSSAMSATNKKQIMDRVVMLIKAVKFAREEANATAVERKTKLGEKLISFIFASK